MGVAIDIGSKTAIIVDTESDSVLETFIKRMKPAYDRIAHKETRKEGLVGLAAIVNYALEYDQDTIISTYRDDFQSNQAVVMRPLGEFITIKKGICFQRALLTGAALEYAKKTGVLSADTDISVESGYSDDLGEYHAFVRFCTDDELWQIDLAQRRDELASFIGIVKE